MEPATQAKQLDADVLIDYAKAARGALRLIAGHLGPVYVSSLVLHEVNEIDASACEQLGITVYEPTFEELLLAKQPLGPLSLADRTCLIVSAKRKWTVVTNDGALRKACKQQGVHSIRGLVLLELLVKSAIISAKDAIAYATAIHAANPQFINAIVLKGFIKNLED